jgi:hypothetical protein
MNGDWDELKGKFCLAFFPMSRIGSLPRAILDFEQYEESIHAGPDLSLPDGMILRLFCLGLDIYADLCLDVTARGRFTHKPMTEQVEFLKNFIDRHTSSVIRTKPLQAKAMSSVEESSSVETKHIPSLGLTHEPSPEPRTPKKRVIHPSEFPIEFGDYGNISKYCGHKKLIFPSEEDSPRVNPSKEWLMEVKRSSKAIQILSPSTTMPCSLRETIVEALHNSTVETNIMSEFLAKALFRKMPLVSTNKLFKNPSGLIFECCGIARAMPVRIHETEVHLDFHIMPSLSLIYS